MATVTHSGTLPDSSQKTDFYAIIDNATISSIVNADIGAGAAIANNKLAAITSASTVHRSAIYGDTGAIQAVFDGGGSTVAASAAVDISIPFACTLTSATGFFDTSADVRCDIWKCTTSAFDNTTHPVIGDTICSTASSCTYIDTAGTAAHKYQAVISPAWTTAIAAGSVLRFVVEENDVAERILVYLAYTRP